MKVVQEFIRDGTSYHNYLGNIFANSITGTVESNESVNDQHDH